MKFAAALVVVPPLFLAACGSLGTTVREESDPYADQESYTREVSLGSQDRFDEARQLEMERNFPGAIAVYRNLYQTSTDDEIKARALLDWARAERSAFNPDRDPDAAAARLRLLLETYPDSAVAPEARALLEGSG